MIAKEKICKGQAWAKGQGCGELKQIFKFGLDKPCYAKFLFHSEAGQKYYNKIREQAHKKTLEKIYSKQKRPPRKLEDMPMNDLKEAVRKICNLYIRTRDIENFGSCISSGNKIHDAGHRFSVGSNEALRFSPQNIHGQNRNDNGWLGGNTAKYDQGLTLRHGFDYLEELYDLNAKYKARKYLDRNKILAISKLYKQLLKTKTWIYRHEDFEKMLNVIENEKQD